MAHIKLTKGALIGSAWREKGEVVEVPPRVAEAYVKAGCGIPVPPPQPVEQATATPHGEQAVAPRQKGPAR